MADTERVINIPIHMSPEGTTPSFYQQQRYTQRQAPSLFTIRDNTVFQSAPNTDLYSNGVTSPYSADYNTGETISVNHLSPPELYQQRSTSPRRLILKGSGSFTQNGSKSSTQQWHPQSPSRSQSTSYDQPLSPATYYVDSNVYQQPFVSTQQYTQDTHYGGSPQVTSYNNQIHTYQQPSYTTPYSTTPTNYSSSTADPTIDYRTDHTDPLCDAEESSRGLVNHFAVQNGYINPSVQNTEKSDTVDQGQGVTSNENSANLYGKERDDSPQSNGTSKQQPSFTPPAPIAGAPPPPPPPPPPIPEGGIPIPPRPAPSSENSIQGSHISGLAAALKSATLKPVSPKVETNGIPAPLVGAKAVLMEEMQRKLARRKAKADGEEVTSAGSSSLRSSPFHTVSRSNTNSPSPVVLKPTPQLQQSPLSNNTQVSNSQTDTLSPQLEQLKQELLMEIRQDLQQLREEILSAIRDQAVL